ncbi:MAG TPA: PepSY domain-containing protein [Dyella sp.]|uniref:PepSY domain-containing protein n=1 Tax=Dyella sp. TaxID=1869338 RepID=UPI002D76C0B9|nr:PepSY domain-containing protein [Dyella sp.]HET6554903.1 PepSY domain-containing protein [Dyella sp.]
MTKRMLPLLIALSITGVAAAQQAPSSAQSVSSATQTTTTVTTWTTTPPSGALTEDAVKSSIATAGYKEVKDLKFKDGVWRTKARGGNKQWVTLAVGPVNGRVYPADAPSKLNEDEVKAKLAADGYENVAHVKFDEGLWNADAKTAHGTAVAVLVDPVDGSVVARSHD